MRVLLLSFVLAAGCSPSPLPAVTSPPEPSSAPSVAQKAPAAPSGPAPAASASAASAAVPPAVSSSPRVEVLTVKNPAPEPRYQRPEDCEDICGLASQCVAEWKPSPPAPLPDCAAFCDGQREIMEIYGCMALHGRECDAFKTCVSKATRGVRRKGEEGKMGPKRP